MKKTLLTLGTSALALAPLATVVACKDDVKTGYENIVEIIVPWDDERLGGVYDAVASYNDQKADSDDFLEVRVQEEEESYGGIVPAFETKLAAKRTDIPNLAITYPDTLGVLSYYGAALDLNTGSQDAYGVDRSKYEAFAKSNDQIVGLEPGGYYATSFGRSIDMLALNLPVIKHFTDLMSANGVKFEGESFEAVNNLTVTTEEADYIATLHPVKATAPAGSTTVYDETTFTHMDKLLDFVTEAIQYTDTEKGIFSISSGANALYQYTFSKGMGTYDNFLFNKDSDNNINYHFGDTTSGGYKGLDSVYSAYEEAINAKALTTRYSGATHSRTGVMNHEFMIGLASTSGYADNFEGNTAAAETLQEDQLKVLVGPTKFDSASSEATLLQGAGMVAAKTTAARDTATRKFVEWFYNTSSKVTLYKDGSAVPAADQKSPAEHIAELASYVYTGYFEGGASIDNDIYNAFNPAQKLTADALQNIDGSSYFGFENPVGNETDGLRRGVEDTFEEATLAAYDDGATFSTYAEYLAALKVAHSYAFE